MRQAGFALTGFALALSLAFFLAARGRPAVAQPASGPLDAAGPRVGASVAVYLRGDAAGASFQGRVPDVGNLIARRGTFVRMDGQFFVLKAEVREDWIPQTSIMLVEVVGG